MNHLTSSASHNFYSIKIIKQKKLLMNKISYVSKIVKLLYRFKEAAETSQYFKYHKISYVILVFIPMKPILVLYSSLLWLIKEKLWMDYFNELRKKENLKHPLH